MREVSLLVASNGVRRPTTGPTISGPGLPRTSLCVTEVVLEIVAPFTTSPASTKEMLVTICPTGKARPVTHPIAIKQGPQTVRATGIGEGSPSLAAVRPVPARSSRVALIDGRSRRNGPVPIRGAA